MSCTVWLIRLLLEALFQHRESPWKVLENQSDTDRHGTCKSLKSETVVLKKTDIFYFSIYSNACWAPHLEMSPTLNDCNYSAVLCFQVDPLRSSRMRLCMSDCSFTQRVFKYPPMWLQRCLVLTWLVPRETAATSTHVPCTPCQPCTSLQCHFIRSYMRTVHVSLA